MNVTQIVVIDNHPIFADILSLAISNQANFFARSCHCYEDVLHHIVQFSPQIAVITVHQDVVLESLELCKIISEMSQQIKIVLLIPFSLTNQGTFMVDAIERGVDSILVREEINLSQLVKALEEIRGGRSIIDTRRLRTSLNVRRHTPSKSTELEGILTNREQEVAHLLADGLATKDIARSLCISERTVQSHISSILSKLDVHTRTEAVVRIYRWRQSRLRGD